MSIVCGIDLSAPSERVAAAAARLAVRLHQPLHLVCSVERAPGEDALVVASRRLAAAARLARLTRRLHELDADVHAHLLEEALGAALLSVGLRNGAQLFVQAGVSLADGGLALEEWLWRAPAPTLSIFDTQRFEEWLEGGRRVRVLLVLGVAPEPRAHTLHAAGESAVPTAPLPRHASRVPPSRAGRQSPPSRPGALARQLRAASADVALVCPPATALGAAPAPRLYLAPAELARAAARRSAPHPWRPGVS